MTKLWSMKVSLTQIQCTDILSYVKQISIFLSEPRVSLKKICSIIKQGHKLEVIRFFRENLNIQVLFCNNIKSLAWGCCWFFFHILAALQY